MRIGIDFRIYKTGIGRYARNLVRELSQIDQQNHYVVFLSKNGFEEFQPPNEKFEKVLADYSPYSFAEQILFCWQLWRSDLDLVHFTNFNVPILYPGRYVVTIHDLIHMSHSTFGSSTRNYLYYLLKKFIYQLVIRWTAWRAEKVIVPSQATKDDVTKYLRINPEKVVVTYEGLDKNLKTQTSKVKSVTHKLIREKLGVKGPYLLYVATMYPHKNHRKLIEVFEMLLGDYPDLQLVLVGKVDHFSKKLKAYAEEKGLADRVHFPNFEYDDGYVPDEALRSLYANASAYVFPSLKEGFGIPVLEAQAYGIPVVTSDIPSLREIGGDSVLYFDPEGVDDIAEKITTALEDSDVRQDLIEKGYRNIKRFSWRRMAVQTVHVYESVR